MSPHPAQPPPTPPPPPPACYRAETRNQIQTQEGEITPKIKKKQVVILVCDMSSGPVLHNYQVSSKYSK